MMKNYGKKFGFSTEVMKQWQSEPLFLEGKNDVLIILVHGWTLNSQQMLPIAKVLNQKGYSVSLPLLSGHGGRPEDLNGVKWSDWEGDIVREVQKRKQEKKYNKIFIGGTSMGGNACLLAALQERVAGIILLGTPVHFKNHFFFKIGGLLLPLFKKYAKKRRPQGIKFKAENSYQYFPTTNVNQVLLLIRRSVFSLKRIKVPILILQASNDFFIAKYSPWIIYKNVSSKIKKMRWIYTDSENHVPQGEEALQSAKEIDRFVKEVIEAGRR
jgi:carboxylesterase